MFGEHPTTRQVYQHPAIIIEITYIIYTLCITAGIHAKGHFGLIVAPQPI
jgi:hypothetical protein